MIRRRASDSFASPIPNEESDSGAPSFRATEQSALKFKKDLAIRVLCVKGKNKKKGKGERGLSAAVELLSGVSSLMITIYDFLRHRQHQAYLKYNR